MTETVTITIAGTPTPIVLFDSNTLEAAEQAAAAAASAAAAQALVGPVYADTTAGLAATASGGFFAVNNSGIVTIYQDVAGSAVAQRTLPTSAQLAGATGASLIGTSDASNVQAKLDILLPLVDASTGALIVPNGSASVPSMSFTNDKDTGLFRSSANVIGVTAGGSEIALIDATGVSIGGALGTSRLDIYTSTSFTGNALDLFHYSDQTNASNTTTAKVVHNYTDGGTQVLDGVGAGIISLRRQARNPSARPDKASTYVGTGFFEDNQRSTTTGTGGNLSTGNNRLRYKDAACREIRLGVDAGDWNGNFTTAPDQWRALSGASKGGSIGWRDSTEVFQITSIDDGVAFKGIDVGCLAFRPSNDNATPNGASSQRWSVVYAGTGTINTSDEREKIWRGAATAAEMRAAKRIAAELGFFQWKDAVEGRPADPDNGIFEEQGKGESARYHFGVRAQRVWAIMAEEGLIDPIKNGRPGKTPYAFLCFDEWDEVREPVMEDYEVERDVLVRQRPLFVDTGVVNPKTKRPVMRAATESELKPRPEDFQKAMVVEQRQAKKDGKPQWRVIRPAGNRFGIRTEQLNSFLISMQEQRLAALEASHQIKSGEA